MLHKGEISVEPFSGHKVSAKSLEILLPRKHMPLWSGLRFMDPIKCPKLLNSAVFKNNLILKQEKSIENLIEKSQEKCNKLDVCNIPYINKLMITKFF